MNPKKTYKNELINIIKKKDPSTDYTKSAELIISLLNDHEIISSFNLEISKLYKKFENNLFINDKEQIQLIINQENANLLNKGYIEKINSNFINNDLVDFKYIYCYYCPYIQTIYKEAKCVIIGDFILNSKTKDNEKYFILLSKFLSQEKRYKIIKLLSKRKYYSNELAKELNLSAATMNYHINKLYELGLIIIEEGSQNRLYIDLNKNRLKFLLEGIQNDLL